MSSAECFLSTIAVCSFQEPFDVFLIKYQYVRRIISADNAHVQQQYKYWCIICYRIFAVQKSPPEHEMCSINSRRTEEYLLCDLNFSCCFPVATQINRFLFIYDGFPRSSAASVSMGDAHCWCHGMCVWPHTTGKQNWAQFPWLLQLPVRLKARRAESRRSLMSDSSYQLQLSLFMDQDAATVERKNKTSLILKAHK